MTSEEKRNLEFIKTQAIIELKKIEQQNSAKEDSNKIIIKTAVHWIVLLIIVGVIVSFFLPKDSLPAIVGLVFTAILALISMLESITGTKEEKPEFNIIYKLLQNLDASTQSTSVVVDKDKVTISKGDDTIPNHM